MLVWVSESVKLPCRAVTPTSLLPPGVRVNAPNSGNQSSVEATAGGPVLTSPNGKFKLSVGTFQQGAGGNYAQVGSDALDRALAEAASADTVDQEYDAINRADAEAWQVAGLVPLYQRPAIYGVRRTVANLGAPGLADFVYENIGLVRP